MREPARELAPTLCAPAAEDSARLPAEATAKDIRPRLPTPIAHDIAPAAGILTAVGYLCVAGVLFLAFAGSGEGALLGVMVFVAFGVMIGLVCICIGLGPKPEKPIDADERRRRGVHTGSGHLESHHATLQIIIAPAALTLAIALIALVASCVR